MRDVEKEQEKERLELIAKNKKFFLMCQRQETELKKASIKLREALRKIERLEAEKRSLEQQVKKQSYNKTQEDIFHD